MTGKVEHAHVILRIAEGHDLRTRDAEPLADDRERGRLADALDRRLVEPRGRLDKGELSLEAAADVCKARHENLVRRSRQDLDGRKAARLDGIGDVRDDLDLEVVVAALILDLVAARVRREDGLAVIDDRRELWIRLEVAQEAQRRRAVDGLVEKDFPRRRILDAAAVIREQQAVVVLEVEGLRLTREPRRLTAGGQHDRHAVLLDGEQCCPRLLRDLLLIVVERAIEVEGNHLIHRVRPSFHCASLLCHIPAISAIANSIAEIPVLSNLGGNMSRKKESASRIVKMIFV